MNRLDNAEFTKPTAPAITRDGAQGAAAEPLEINVIFTEVEATAAALKAAESFARELGARIRLRAGLVVPVQLPLDQPLVSVEFAEKALRDLVSRSETDGVECAIHLYLCRDWIDTLLEVLKPDSIVVIAARKRRWPTAASRLVRALRANYNRVIVVDANRHKKGNDETVQVADGRIDYCG